MSYNVGAAPLNIDPQFVTEISGSGDRPRIHVYNSAVYVVASGTEFKYRPTAGAFSSVTYASIGMPTDIKVKFSCVTSSGVLVVTEEGQSYFITSDTTSVQTSVQLPVDLVDCNALGDGSRVIVAGFRPAIVAGSYQRQLVLLYGLITDGVFSELDLSGEWVEVAAGCYPFVTKRATDNYVVTVHAYRAPGGHSPTGNSYDIHNIEVDVSGVTPSVTNVSTVDTVEVPRVVQPFEIGGTVCFWGGGEMYAYDASTYTTFTSVFTDADLSDVTLSGDAPSSEKAVYADDYTFSTSDGVSYTKTARV